MRQPVTARARAALEQPRAIALQQEQHGASAGTADPVSRHDRARRSFVARAIAAAVALLSWLGPVQVSWQAARQSAATIALHGTTVDSPFTSWRTTGRLLVRWGLRQAQAGAITDPTAPIRFTPTLTQTTGANGGVPVINVTTPNASGLSYNLLRSLTVDGVGLILNNSLLGGGTLLGGNVTGNANLAVSGSASTILTQVTGTDPIRINGTVEVFGTPASVIFAAPAGVYTQGAGFTNTPRVTLSTGTPQFLNGSGANVAFDQATAVGFLVNSGRVQIDPAAGSTAGAGIEGTVGAINLIGQTVGVNAPLFAGNQINVIAGNQQVAPVATGTGRAGSDWQVSGTGANGAANSASAQNGLAIDATAFGAMTAGQIKLISTAQGLGVRAAGDLAANTSNVNIDANGDVSVGNVYGHQNVGVTSTGTVTTTGTVKAQQDVALSANGDLTVGGTAQAGNNLTLNAGGNLTGAGNLAAAKALTAVAGDSVKLTGSLNATHLAVSAQGQDGTGDVALGGSVSSPNTITLTAARDLSATGPITTNGDLQATAGRDIAIAGATQSSGATVLNAGRDIGVANMGSVAAGTTLSATTGRNLTVSGGTASGGDTTLTASGGTLATSGAVLAGGNVTANGQAGTTLSGTVYAAKGVTAQSSAGATSATGSVVAHSGNVALTGTSVAVSGSTQSGGDTALRATQGDATIDGQAAALGKLTVTASQDITGQGSTASVGDTALTAGHDIALTGSSQTAGNLAATAGNRLALSALPVVGGDATLNGVAVVLGASGKTSQVNGTLTATGTQSLATAGTINTATANLTGGTVTNSGTVSASRTLAVAGTTITNSGTLGGATATVHGADVANAGLIGGQTVSVTADNTLSNQNGTLLGTKSLAVAANTLTSNRNGVMFAGSPSGTTPGQGDLSATVSGGSGSFNNAGGQILAGNNATINLRNQTVDGANLGTINANGTLTYNVGGVANTGAWTVGGKSATINAANGIANTGSIQHAGDLTLSTPGAVTNSGQIIAGNDLAVSGGGINNAAGATLHADHDLSVTGATTNRGTVEALNDVRIAGAGYDNAGALTQANRDLNVNVSGNVLNQGGTIGAGRDVNLSAGQIINDATASGGASTTVVTGQEVNPTYLSQIVIGREQLSFSLPGSEPGSPDYMPIYRAVTIGDLKPDANGVIYGYLATELVRSLHDQYVDFWHLGSMVDHPATALVTLPTVTRTETTTQAGVSGIIRAGRNLAVTASTLSNNGGQISAAGNITMAVGTLNNGASAGASKTITESIDGAVLNSFMAQLYDALHSGTKPMFSDAVMSDGCSDGCPTPHWFVMQTQVVPGTFHTVPAATSPAPQVTVQQTAGKQGVIAAGGSIDLTQVGTLNNGGQIAAVGNISLGGSVNNVGQQLVNRTTLPGCVGNPATCTNAVGNSFSGTSAGPWDSPTYDVIDPKQQVASIVAGGTLTANAAQLTNQTGTITAAGNVLITAPTVTNTGGTIQSKAGSVTINAANGLVNQAAPTTTVHQSHGSDVAPCGKSGSGNCDTATQTATGDAGMILAAGDLTVNAGSVRNNGGAMVAGGNNTITTGSFDNSPVFLRQYYHWMFLDQDSNASDRWGCDSAGDISGCQRAFGGNLRNGTNANAENAPTIGVLNSYVSGGNLTIRSGGAIINSGNIEGTAISLSGATITNGITNPSIQTPPSTSGRQVVSLGPIGTANAQLPVTGTPDTFSGPTTVVQQGVPNPSNPGTANGRWQFNPVVVTTQSGGAVAWHFNTPLDGAAMSAPTASGSTAQYLSNSPATAVLGGVGPQTLINALPADLRPGGTPFYYDPQAENQRLDQAALAQTGRTSFINGLTYDSQTHLTADDQQKLILYQNAVDYAKAHNVQLGQALTPEQLAALDKPMLWYVTQQVPDPNCLSGACPMVSALVPQVYLPQGYSGIEPGGSIVASKSLELLADSPIRNTGTLGSYGTLTSNTTIINEQRAAEMTAAWQPIEDGWARTTGQQGQANSGFVFAANAAGIAGQIQNINGVVAQLNADGTMSAAEAARVAAAVQAGMQAVTSTHTDTFVRSEGWFGQLFAGVVMVAIGIMTGGAAMAAYAGVGATLTVGQAMAQAAVASMTTNTMQQASSGQGFSFGALVKAGATSALTAGITQGITLNANGTLGTVDSLNSVASDRSLAALSGAKNVGNGLTQAAASSGTLGEQLTALTLGIGIKAGVTTAINGGSFGRALTNTAASDIGAVAANVLGTLTPGIGEVNASPNSVVGNILGHVALGCATSSMQGTGCAGGAAGGLAGSVVAPLVGMGLYAGTSGTNSAIDAATVAIGAMAGGAIAHAIGGDTTAGASTAQNAAMNNWLDHRRPNAVVYSEQERRDNAAAACKDDPKQCDVANSWEAKSKQRNAELQAACANLSSDTCRSAMATAQAAGNYIVFAGGKVYAYGKEDPVARSLDPSPAAKTLDTMVGSPLAGIFGGIPYFKSNADPAAGYYFAQYGMALEGIGAGVLGLPTGPLAGPGWRAALESPNTLYVGSGASSALPTWTNVAGPYSAVGQGGGVATTVRAGPGYTAQDVLPRPAAPTFSGSGPVPGVIAITDSTSVGALKNYYPSGGGIEFVYDPTTNTFAVGAPKVGLFDGSPHQKLAQSIGANDQNIVGGTFSRAADGSIATTENSGHYGQNWTPQIANQFQKWLSDRVGVPVNHQPWGSK
ncbi:polymorphic toxin type 43 domain-containing protein [Ralstonia pseudosolanacearum]|uniref:beta strand repeat-containing protein n=1 Tax=Ralstonia pseudosolanacearum TaxID=1310165 RepID=UPI00267652DE|nr:polymorphic toxin type 43 domain-containing protein [Ralstonia pseudosolanacearum]MDO3509620.1 polymorphic toxin type 43 domain-containing protein [Ralstonia pseudosolanacearum]MDO3511928.1 polymorphic toxin type 43 domain-containing protein [Ralstonia pseudosolanacearum]MDO3536547.1 polymorphic toxin type 43 domain-containing protein [Ralstonia pseudosolanacearum]MDO3605809.1 polymorphic toxin type 43 domain-containing protein [Ralstonia pseudosolanacearum]MDO3610617.1 polymorphic toxin ty